MFNAEPDSSVELRCGQVPMYTGKMGRKGDRIAIRIEGKAPKKKV
jgi:flagellar motor switch protein FliM